MTMIEPAMNTDGPRILQIAAATNVFNSVELSCVEELWNAYQDKGEASGYAFLVSRDGNRVFGYSCFGPHSLTQGTYDLYWIAVDPEFQGRGIGHTLLAKVETEVKAQGGHLLLIETSNTPPYISARHFYEGYGYHNEALVRNFYDRGDDLIIYAKDLSSLEKRS